MPSDESVTEESGIEQSSQDFDFETGDFVRISLNTDRKGVFDAVCVEFNEMVGSDYAVFEVPGLNPSRVSLRPAQAEFEVIGDV